MKIKPCKHQYGFFNLKIEGERDRYYLGCAICGRKIFHRKPKTDFHILENLEVVANQNIFNAEKYFK